MGADKLKAQLSTALLKISERCVAGALAATSMVLPGQSALATTTSEPNLAASDIMRIDALAEKAAPSSEGAINLEFISTDANSGEQVARHYSHASHASHQSHYSHYSSR